MHRDFMENLPDFLMNRCDRRPDYLLVLCYEKEHGNKMKCLAFYGFIFIVWEHVVALILCILILYNK